MKTGIDEQQELFRPIDLELLKVGGSEVFDLYYKNQLIRKHSVCQVCQHPPFPSGQNP